jgi:hypothetical protein
MIRKYRAHRRAYSLFFIGVFSFMGWADASGLHFCPQHDALFVTASPSDDTAQNRGPSDFFGAAWGYTESGHSDDREGPCTCIGSLDVGGSALQAALPAAPFLDFPTIAYLPGAHASTATFTASRYRLPYANAPPLVI